MEDETKTDVELSAWNLSEIMIQQIGTLLSRSQISFTAGDYAECFSAEREIKMVVYADLNEDETSELAKLEETISLYLKLSKPGVLSKQRTHEFQQQLQKHFPKVPSITQCASTLYENLIKYRETIRKLLKKYGYSTQKREDSSRMFKSK